MKLDELHRGGYFLDARSTYDEARTVLVGVPMDLTSSFRSGSREGPQAIRSFSQALEDYSPYLDRELGECLFYDAGDLMLPFGNVDVCLEKIEQTCKLLVRDQKLPFFLGGEHLISLPIVKSLSQFYSDLVVLHFDAHADLRDEYLGEKYSHATVMRRICDIIGSKNVFQFGIRSGTKEEFRYGKNCTNFYPLNVLDALNSCYSLFKDRPLYVTLDIDVIDPAYAPGTGTPEPGGVKPEEIFGIFSILKTLHVVGCDFVELAPLYDLSGITSLLAAKLVREAILAFT